jgi:hypothetical protein
MTSVSLAASSTIARSFARSFFETAFTSGPS